MKDEMFDAIRALVDFSRNDARYSALVANNPARKAYLQENLERIAAENGVVAADLRSEAIRLYEADGKSRPSGPYVPDPEDRRIAERIVRGP